MGESPAIDPWKIPCDPTNEYTNEIKRINLPFTDVIQGCHICNRMMWLKCKDCQGAGYFNCSECNGNKYVTTRTRTGRGKKNLQTEKCPMCYGMLCCIFDRLFCDDFLNFIELIRRGNKWLS